MTRILRCGLLAALLLAACAPSPDHASDPETANAADADSAAAIETEVETDWHLAALKSCAPTAGACDAPSAATRPVASYRPDFFYPREQYAEAQIPDPVGGRVQLAAVAQADGAVVKVEIAGVDVTPLAVPELGVIKDESVPDAVWALVADDSWHWVQAWPAELKAGEPFYLAWHVGTPAFEGASSVAVRVTTTGGVALDADVPLAEPKVRLTYVTTSEDLATLIVHARNDDAVPHELTALEVRGLDVTAAACIADPVIAPGAAATWRVPLCKPLEQGDPWTVVARFADAPPTTGAGRVVLPHFPVFSWVWERECPFPGANDAGFQRHREQGFDTLFLRGSYDGGEPCKGATSTQILDASADIPDQYFLLDEWAPLGNRDTSRLARMLGDEEDSRAQDKPFLLSRDAKISLRDHPRLTTYLGASRHRRAGAFAGIADVQGMDIYFAICAPSILVDRLPPLRAPFDYFRAVRTNHAPGTTWFYAQAMTARERVPGKSFRVPNATEIKLAGLSVLASGAKGLMYFQTALGEIAQVPETWAAIGEVNRVTRAVRSFLREGEPTGAARTSEGELLVEAIRDQQAIVVPVLNTRAAEAMDYTRCFTEEHPHWVLAEVTSAVDIDIPDDFEVVDLLEVDGDGVHPVTEAITASGRTLTLHDVTLSDARPYRLFVVAGAPTIAARMEASATAD